MATRDLFIQKGLWLLYYDTVMDGGRQGNIAQDQLIWEIIPNFCASLGIRVQ